MNNPQPWWLTLPVAEVAAAALPLFTYPPCPPGVWDTEAIGHIITLWKTGWDVDHIHVPRIQPAATIPVQIDPANPQKVRIEFDQPIT